MTFGLVKHNNNSISAITTPGSLAQGKMTLLQTQTASSSSSISFTSNIDSTYPIYVFKHINIHANTNQTHYTFNGSTDSGSNYNVTKTTTVFQAYHWENDSDQALQYNGSNDLAQSTSFQRFTSGDSLSSSSDSNLNSIFYLFNPSSTTFVKHFMLTNQFDTYESISLNNYVSGYFNTTSAINAVQFKMESGNFNGTIKLYGIKGS